MPHPPSAVVGLVFVLLARGVDAKEAWFEISSPSFVLVTNASEKHGRALLETAERFRAALGQALPQLSLVTRTKTRLYGFRDAVSLEPFLPRPGEEPASVSGYFRDSGVGNVVVLDLGMRRELYERVLFHEYLHLALSLSERKLPLWFEEGLSEFYASTKLRRREAELGNPNSRHVSVLTRSELIPLEELLVVDESSERYQDREKRALLYAQSWALVHYLLVAAPRGQEELARFLAATAAGEDALVASEHAFARTTSVLEQELRHYVKRGDYPTVGVGLAAEPSTFDVAAKRLTVAEVQNRWGDLFLANGRTREALMCLEEAARLDPGLASAQESLGLLHLREGDPERAKARFERAIELEGASADGLYRYAKLALADYDGSWVSEIPRNVGDVAVSALRRSLALEPGARAPSELLAFVYLVRGERLDEAAELLDGALAASPEEDSLLFLKAQLLAKRGKYGFAREALRRVLETDDPALKKAASQFLSKLNELERAPGR